MTKLIITFRTFSKAPKYKFQSSNKCSTVILTLFLRDKNIMYLVMSVKCIVTAKRMSLLFFEEKCSGMNVSIPVKPYTVSTNKLHLLFLYFYRHAL